MSDLRTTTEGAADGDPGVQGLDAAADPIHRLREEREAEQLQALRDLGRNTLHLLHQLQRNFQLYEAENAVFKRPLEEFEQAIRNLYGQLGEVRLLLVEGQPYLGDLRLRADSTNAATIKFLELWMGNLGIGGWAFAPPPNPNALREFFAKVAHETHAGEGALDRVEAWLAERGFDWVRPLAPHRFREADEEVLDGGDESARIPDLFRQGIDATQQYFGMLGRTGIGPTLMARKAVNVLVDLTLQDGERALSANLLKDQDHGLYTHSLHVAVLSMALGKALKVPRALLAELGLAGMFHDTGLSELPMQDEDEDEGIDADTLLAMHTLTGFRSQLGRPGFHPSRLLRAVVNLEHHLGVGRRGEEDWDDPVRPLHPFSRIVAVAEAYVTLTTDTQSRAALSPAAAVDELWHHRGTLFDPLVVQALVNLVGRYPTGTLVELNDGSFAVVVRCGGDAEGFDRPTVRTIRSGRALRKGLMYDLRRVPKDKLTVIRICDPQEEGFAESAVLLGQKEPGT